MKKTVITIVCIAAALFVIYFVGTGLLKSTSVFIEDYVVSENGDEITLTVGNSSSVGYVRKAAVHQQQGGKLYVDFYSAFGGLNGKIGASSDFTLPLDKDTEIIAVYTGSGSYREVLKKNSDGEWERTL